MLTNRIVIGCGLWLMVTVAQAADYHLPFAGRWFVMQGGDSQTINHHHPSHAQRYGVDFIRVGGEGGLSLSPEGSSAVEDFYGWDSPVLSPVDAVVVDVHDGVADNPLGQKNREAPFGNYLVLKAGEAEFVFLAQLRQGSIKVKKGDKVERGSLLARVGNSGYTELPHLHMHVQDSADPAAGEGRNVTFINIDVDLSGKSFDGVNWPMHRGIFVSNSEE